ncbi:unnamed protein product [Durusdinium trenchii]|uniref:Uncharacterized protein n=1 Tax=Durusdinium trenchii TaxID=1381693 RepID=A0ABP0KTG3_9DINO
MLRYVARILTTAGIFAKDLEALDQWIHSDWDDAINGYKSTSYFSLYIPRLQRKQRVERIPHRRNQTDTQHGTVHVFASHAAEEGNLLNLLQSGRFKPSTNHSPTAQGFYAQGYDSTGKLIYDAWRTARVIDKTCQMPKNRAGIILHCMAWGTGKKFLQAGELANKKEKSPVRHPEMMWLHWTINLPSWIIDSIQHHPIMTQPIPPMDQFPTEADYHRFRDFRINLMQLSLTGDELQSTLREVQSIPHDRLDVLDYTLPYGEPLVTVATPLSMTHSLTVHVTTTRRSPITYLPINLDHLHFHIRMMYMILLRLFLQVNNPLDQTDYQGRTDPPVSSQAATSTAPWRNSSTSSSSPTPQTPLDLWNHALQAVAALTPEARQAGFPHVVLACSAGATYDTVLHPSQSILLLTQIPRLPIPELLGDAHDDSSYGIKRTSEISMDVDSYQNVVTTVLQQSLLFQVTALPRQPEGLYNDTLSPLLATPSSYPSQADYTISHVSYMMSLEDLVFYHINIRQSRPPGHAVLPRTPDVSSSLYRDPELTVQAWAAPPRLHDGILAQHFTLGYTFCYLIVTLDTMDPYYYWYQQVLQQQQVAQQQELKKMKRQKELARKRGDVFIEDEDEWWDKLQEEVAKPVLSEPATSS